MKARIPVRQPYLHGLWEALGIHLISLGRRSE